jgi:hypothetical protein
MRIFERDFGGEHPSLTSVKPHFALGLSDDRLAGAQDGPFVVERALSMLRSEKVSVGLADGF